MEKFFFDPAKKWKKLFTVCVFDGVSGGTMKMTRMVGAGEVESEWLVQE